MSRVDTVSEYYGIFFKQYCPAVAVSPYAVVYEETGGNAREDLAAHSFSRENGERQATWVCLALTPILLPLTVATFALATALAAIGVVLAPFVYAGAAIADCHSPELPDNSFEF